MKSTIEKFGLAILLVALCGIMSSGCYVEHEQKSEPEAKPAKPTYTPAPEGYTPKPDEFVPVEVEPVKDSCPELEYPEEAKAAGLEGVVYIQALVSATGDVTDVRIAKSSAFKLLDDAAIRQAWECKYRPAIQSGKPVALWVSYRVTFPIGKEGRRR